MKLFKALCVLAILVGMFSFAIGWPHEDGAMQFGALACVGGVACFIGARIAE